MKIKFQEEFELEKNGSYYWIETSGFKETDEEDRVFTHLETLSVTDELGNELNDTSDVYNNIKEHLAYNTEFEPEQEENWDEEIIPNWIEDFG